MNYVWTFEFGWTSESWWALKLWVKFLLKDEYQIIVELFLGGLTFELGLNVNYGLIWNMVKYELAVNMIHG